jgi:uncharacterized protein
MRRVLVAFSAGVDSTLLLYVASKVLAKNVFAVTAVSATYPALELKEANLLAERFAVPLITIRSQEFKNPDFVKNPPNRCYYCKKELFSRLRKIACQKKIAYILDGSNLDDAKDFRPGRQAKEELLIRSPLAEARLTKKDIRQLSRTLGLSTWDKPALACLASRVPYGQALNISVLRRIDDGENFLRQLGFKQVRLRHFDHTARIEVEKAKIKQLCKGALLDKVIDRLKNLGYNYVTVDLEGYRTGSLNHMRPKLTERKRS